MSYVAIKHVHLVAAILTICGFLLRGYWMLTESELLQHRATRIVPHVNDAILLAAALGLLWVLHLNPFTQSWLIAKFVGLALYILLGTVALRRGSTLRVRAIALVGAVAAFAYIYGVALAKSPFGWATYWAR